MTEHGGIELFDYIQQYHPFMNSKIDLNAWKHHIQYHFRIIVRCLYYLHKFCGIAHLDLSLENCVINDNIIRIIDFGLAKQDKQRLKNKWKCNQFVGKTVYQSPEMRKLKHYLIQMQIQQIEQKINDTNNNDNNTHSCSCDSGSVSSEHSSSGSSNSTSCGASSISIDVGMDKSNINTITISSRSGDTNEVPGVDEVPTYNPFSADIWTLGVMLFVMLTGAQPWNVAENTENSFNAIMNGDIEALLVAWESTQYVDADALGMFQHQIFVYFCVVGVHFRCLQVFAMCTWPKLFSKCLLASFTNNQNNT